MERIKRIGIFGGSFNPIHNGHINCILTALKHFKFDLIKVVPSYQSPSGKYIESPSPEMRYNMVKKALQTFAPQVEVDLEEINRKGVSYTIDTIRAFKDKYPLAEFFLIIGLDQFYVFDQWKEYEEILKEAHLVVASRPHLEFPQKQEDFPQGMQSIIKEMHKGEVELLSGKKIYFLQLKDLDISSTQLRNRLRKGENVSQEIPKEVVEYIKKENLYGPLPIKDYHYFSVFIGQLLMDKKAHQVVGYDLRKLDKPMEYSLVASGSNVRHTSALADFVIKKVKETFGVYPLATEGLKEGRWIVLDYGALIVHIFYDYVRFQYQLEDLWKEGEPLDFHSSDSKIASF